MLGALVLVPGLWADNFSFSTVPDYQTGDAGYYYVLPGGQFVNGQTTNGTNGAIWFVYQDSYWQSVYGLPEDQWTQDTWYTGDSGIAVTMFDRSGDVVYDNNGIDTDPSTAQTFYNSTAGDIVGYSMANTYDWIYAGLIQLTAATAIDRIDAFFVADGWPAGFDPNNPLVDYRMNIFSADDGQPTNTGGFFGDVLTSDSTGGTFTWSDTGLTSPGDPDSEIYRLTYTLNQPVTLQPGSYYFSSDADYVPEPSSWLLLATVVVLVGRIALRKRPA
jgi:hypothetical protein